MRLLSLFLALIIYSVPISFAQASCGCTTTIDTNVKTLTIDSTTGNIINGKTVYEDFTKLQIVFDNQNPFKHQYKFGITSQALKNSIITDAMSKIGLSIDTEQTNIAKGFHAPVNDPRLEKNKIDIESLQNCPIPKTNAINNEANSIKTEFSSFQNLIKELSSANQCQTICDLITNAANYDKLSKFDSDSFNNKITSAKQELKQREGTCAFVDVNKNKKSLEAHKALSDRLSKALPEIKNNLKLIGDIKNGDIKLTTVRTIPEYSKAFKHNVKVANWLIGKPNEVNEYNHELTIGTSLFSYSAGLGLSFIESYQYGVGQTNIGTNTESTADKIVVIEDKSSREFGLIGQLNARIKKFDNGIDLMWSVGASINNGNNSKNFGFYTGPSFSYLNDDLIVTLGYHLAKIEKPQAGYHPGAILPAEHGTAVPMKSKTQEGFLLGFTWKLD